MGEFKKYKFTKQQIIKLCSEAEGVLAIKTSSFTGLFDYLKTQWNIKASDVVQIIDHYPEFVFLNRSHMLRKKLNLIRKHSKHNYNYLRQLIKRHPELFLK